MSTNWIGAYGTKQPRRYQAGGPMGAPAEAEMAPQGGAPDIEGMLAEYAQSRDPQLAVAIADMLVEIMMAQQGAPAGAEGAPMARRGMRMSRGPIFKK